MIEHPPAERHQFALRTLTVSAVTRIGASMVRVTFAGPELEGFVSRGPADHVKAFFPDPVTGEIAAPTMTDEGLKRPETGTAISRDYTPRAFREATPSAPAELDIDFVVHGEGPASNWADSAVVGSTLVVGGPRGSRPIPTGVTRVILGADESALPAAARWIEELPADVDVCAFVELDHPSDAVYLDPELVHRASVIWLEKGGLDRAIRNLGEVDDTTYVWVAGESNGLIPVRRYLRRELGLPANQVKVDGYWRSGEAGRDHHAPIDPQDPED